MFTKSLLLIVCLLFPLIIMVAGCSSPAPLSGRQDGAQTEQNTAKKRVIDENREDIGIPYPDEATEQAPEKFKVRVSTTKGDFVIETYREWAPNGADRFYNLVKIGFFTDVAIFRSVSDFMFQFGVHGDPRVTKVWNNATIPDDENVGITNSTGRVTFGNTGAPDSRSVQMFVNTKRGGNGGLDTMGFTPFGEVVEGMEVVATIFVTGENPREVQPRFVQEGNEYIRAKYPGVDFIKSMVLLDENGEPIEMPVKKSASEDQENSESMESGEGKEGDSGEKVKVQSKEGTGKGGS